MSPTKLDSDGDGLPDSEEVAYGTYHLDADTDGDGLNDGDEVINYGTDPLVADTDGDGLNDGDEVDNGTNPLQKEPTTSPTEVRLYFLLMIFSIELVNACNSLSPNVTSIHTIVTNTLANFKSNHGKALFSLFLIFSIEL